MWLFLLCFVYSDSSIYLPLFIAGYFLFLLLVVGLYLLNIPLLLYSSKRGEKPVFHMRNTRYHLMVAQFCWCIVFYLFNECSFAGIIFLPVFTVMNSCMMSICRIKSCCKHLSYYLSSVILIYILLKCDNKLFQSPFNIHGISFLCENPLLL